MKEWDSSNFNTKSKQFENLIFTLCSLWTEINLWKAELGEVSELAEQVELEGKSAGFDDYNEERGKYKPSSLGSEKNPDRYCANS